MPRKVIGNWFQSYANGKWHHFSVLTPGLRKDFQVIEFQGFETV
jgi:hypothetical protein